MHLLDLDAGVLERVMMNLEYTDLLRLGRTCKSAALAAAINADSVWEQQFLAMFGAKGGDKQQFKTRYIQQARDLQLSLKVKRMKLDSDIQQHKREMQALSKRRQEEERRLRQLAARCRELQQAKQAHCAAQQWQLSGVRLYCNRLVQAHPISVDAELANVQQQQRVAQLEMKTITAGIRSRQQRLDRDTRLRHALMG